MIHNIPRKTINYTDAELAILHNSKVSDEVKNALYESKLALYGYDSLEEEEEEEEQSLTLHEKALLKFALNELYDHFVFTEIEDQMGEDYQHEFDLINAIREKLKL